MMHFSCLHSVSTVFLVLDEVLHLQVCFTSLYSLGQKSMKHAITVIFNPQTAGWYCRAEKQETSARWILLSTRLCKVAIRALHRLTVMAITRSTGFCPKLNHFASIGKYAPVHSLASRAPTWWSQFLSLYFHSILSIFYFFFKMSKRPYKWRGKYSNSIWRWQPALL